VVHIAIALPDHHARLGVAWQHVVEHVARLAANGKHQNSARARKVGKLTAAGEARALPRRSLQAACRSEHAQGEGHHG
jgi:hypothetical protein